MRLFEEVINYPAENSFLIKYDDFPNGASSWLTFAADVAINGGNILREMLLASGMERHV